MPKESVEPGGTVGGIQLLQIRETLEQLGADSKRLRRVVGHHPADLERPTVRLPVRLAFRLFDEAERLVGDPNVGLHAGGQVAFRGPLVFLLMACPRLREALETCARFGRLFMDGITVRLDVDERVASLVVDLTHDAPLEHRHFMGYLLVGVVRTLRQAATSPPPLLEVHLRHPRLAGADASESAFGCPVRFRRPDYRLVFAARGLEIPFRMSNPSIQTELHRFTAALIEEVVPSTFRARVERAVRAALASGARANRAVVARCLHVSGRTLQRRLEEEGATFKGTRDAVLRAIVEAQLRDPRLPIKLISASVGFCDIAAFSRAFRRWTGHAPSEFRAAAARQLARSARG